MAQGTVKYRVVFLFALLAAALLGGWLGALAADRDMPTIVYSAEPTSPIVAAGGELRIDYVVRRLRSCAVSVDRFVIDKYKTRYELEDLNVNAGLPLGEDHFIQPIRVPPDAEPGPAIYRTASTYICNPLQRLWPITGAARDISFIVAKP